MNKDKAIEFINNNKGFCYLTTFAGRIKLEALSMVCESSYSGWFNAFNLAYDPKPLLEANIEEFKTLIKKKNRYVICNQHPVLLSGKLATKSIAALANSPATPGIIGPPRFSSISTP